MQKLVRAAFGNNNVDTCARVCHSPTGYGLKTTFGTSAGTQDFDSVDAGRRDHGHRRQPDRRAPGVRLADEAAAARRARELIVVDPRRIDLVQHAARRGRLPPAAAARHQRRGHQRDRARRRHRGPGRRGLRRRALRHACLRRAGARSSPRSATRPRRSRRVTGVPAADVRGAARLYATGGNAAIYYGLGVTEHSQGSTMVMGMANLAMATGNVGRHGVGVNPLRGQNNVQGSCDMGSFPHEFSGYRHVSDDAVRGDVRGGVGRRPAARAGPAHPQHVRRRARRHLQGPLHPGRGHRAVRPEHASTSPPALGAMECVVVQDLFLNETASYAHVFLPGSSFLEKDGTFTNAERRISRVRKVMPPKAGLRRLGSHGGALERARLPDGLQPPVRDHGRDRAPDADLRRRELREARRARQHPVAVQRQRRPRARRSCTSTASCAARASS